MSTEYRPGTCNIGRSERRTRYWFGAVSFLLAIGVTASVSSLSLPRWGLLVTVLPLFGGFIGIYQGRQGFCVRYALEGVYNVSDRRGERSEVEDVGALERDRRQARLLIGQAGASAVLVTAALYVFMSA